MASMQYTKSGYVQDELREGGGGGVRSREGGWGGGVVGGRGSDCLVRK